jgi:hypothetical protein
MRCAAGRCGNRCQGRRLRPLSCSRSASARSSSTRTAVDRAGTTSIALRHASMRSMTERGNATLMRSLVGSGSMPRTYPDAPRRVNKKLLTT